MKINLKDFKFRNEYFPFLLPLFYIMHYYFVNFPFFPVGSAIGLLIQYVSAVAFLNFLFLAFLKTWRKASLFTFSLLSLQFFSMLLYEIFSKRAGDTSLGNVILLAVLISGCAWLFIRLKTASGSLSRPIRFLNVLMVSWILIELFIFTAFRNYLNTELKKTVTIKACTNCNKPDIYLLLLDEYAGQQTLIDKFQFDNSAFLSYLRNKNFHVIHNSKSNYNVTLFSMASMFTLDSIRISNYKRPLTKDFVLAGLKLKESVVGKYFQQTGYEIHNLSLFNFLNLPSPFKHSYQRDFPEELKSQTLTRHIEVEFSKLFFSKSGGSIKNDRSTLDLDYNNSVIDSFLHRTFESERPKFVYAHFLMPHFPHVFYEHGQPVDPKLQYSKDTYLDYLKYANLKIEAIINKILASARKPPIILLMSDHGFRGYSKPTDPKYYFMNLNAIYLPDQNYEGWYDGMSNVNQFRILLNRRFHQNLPLLKDTSVRLMEKNF